MDDNLDDEDDEVVEEVDVYLNKSLADNLYVFQYWSDGSPIAQSRDVNVKARPNHRMFEIETKVDTRSANFDQKKSEYFGKLLAMSDQKSESNKKSDNRRTSADYEMMATNKKLDKQVLKSSEMRPTLGQYCVAVIRSDCQEMHLNPIQSIIQFRPQLNYLDNKTPEVSATVSGAGGGSKSKSSNTAAGDEESEADMSQDETEGQSIQTITMRFAGGDEDKARKAREKTYAFLQQSLAKDSWTPVKCHPIDSQISSDNRMSMIYNSSDDTNNGEYNTSSIASLRDFLERLKCLDETTQQQQQSQSSSSASTATTTTSSQIRCLSQIGLLSYADQVRELLINAKLLSFDEIISLLKGDFDQTSVLKSVQIYALLVRGNWVVKSEILYNREQRPRSANTGIPIEQLCRTRDYLIWRFTQTKSLSKMETFSVYKNRIPDEDVVDILKQIARFDRSTKLWTFAAEDDTGFIDRYPDVVQRQQLLWSNRYHGLERTYNNNNNNTNVVVAIKSEPMTPDNSSSGLGKGSATGQRKRRNSRRVSSNSTTTSAATGGDDTEIIEAMSSSTATMNPSVVDNNIMAVKIKKERKSPTKSMMAATITASGSGCIAAKIKERKRSKSPKMAVFEINTTATPYPADEEFRDLVKLIHERLKSAHCTTSEDLRQYVSDNNTATNRLWLTIAEEVIDKAVVDSGGFRVNNKWPQNATQQPLYAYTKFGDHLDDFRDTLIEMFADQTRIRVTAFIEKVKDKQLTGDRNYDITCNKLLKDYCINKSSVYYLKGTVSPN